jgi:glycosyltransferase involved in cell wall biosynthesis
MADIAIQLGAAPDKVRVIPNGVDLDRFKPVPKTEARRTLNIPNDQPLVVSVASLKPPKGHEDLIRAMATEKIPPQARLVIIGGETDFGAYLRRLRGLVESLGLRGRITFAGVLPQETVAAYFSAADVSVLASYSEGCPNAVLESLACGTPVIGTPVGAIPEWLKDGENGHLVPVGNPSALGSALAEALRKPWSREAVCRSIAGRTWKIVAREVLSVFEKALRVPLR